MISPSLTQSGTATASPTTAAAPGAVAVVGSGCYSGSTPVVDLDGVRVYCARMESSDSFVWSRVPGVLSMPQYGIGRRSCASNRPVGLPPTAPPRLRVLAIGATARHRRKPPDCPAGSYEPPIAHKEVNLASSEAEWKKRGKQRGDGIRDRKGDRTIQERSDRTLEREYCLPGRP